MAGSLIIRPKFSLRLLSLILMVHLLAAASAAVAGVPDFIRALIGVLIAASLLYRVLLHRKHEEIVYEFHEAGELIVKRPTGQELYARILPTSTLWQWLMVIHWCADEMKRPEFLVLMKDSLSAEQWRSLNIWLRWTKQQAET